MLDILVAGENLRGGISDFICAFFVCLDRISDLNTCLETLYLECDIVFKLGLGYIELSLRFLQRWYSQPQSMLFKVSITL